METIGRENNAFFKVPDGYFETLGARIMDRCGEFSPQGSKTMPISRLKVVALRKKVYFLSGMAASVAGIALVVGMLLFGYGQSETPDKQLTVEEYMLQSDIFNTAMYSLIENGEWEVDASAYVSAGVDTEVLYQYISDNYDFEEVYYEP